MTKFPLQRLWRLQALLWGRGLVQARRESLFRVLFVAGFALALLGGLWVLFARSFLFLDTLGGVGLVVIPRLFRLFFFGLGIMLVLSGMLSAYSAMFRSPETAFLLRQPVPVGQVALFKQTEAAGYASWAFFFIILPFLGAYASYRNLSPWFLAWAFLFSIPFVLLCSGIGGLAVLLLVRWFPRRSGLVALCLLAVTAALWFVLPSRIPLRPGGGEDTVILLSELVPGLDAAAFPLWPSWWVAEGLLSLSAGRWGRGAMLWIVLVSHLLLLAWLTEGAGRLFFHRGWERVQTAAGSFRRRRELFALLDRWAAPLGGPPRALLLKDLRLFARDPQLWAQAGLFLGLLALYFANLRGFRYHLLPPEWKNLVAFLNVFSVAAVLSSLGSRFIYPQMSLEGQGFWIVGLSPVSMRHVLAVKFGVALAGMLAVSLGLMALSASMLQADAVTTAIALSIAACTACALCGLSTGLGALFLDLRQTNPSAIVSGFGGTLNLSLNLSFLFAVIFPFALAFHALGAGRITPGAFRAALAWAVAWMVLLTVAATVLPLSLGRRSLDQREY